MPTQTLIATQPGVGPFPTLPVGAGSLALVFTAADAVNGNYFIADKLTLVPSQPTGSIGGDILVAQNTDAAPHNLTFKSQPDAQGRSGDITYSIAAGEISYFQFSQLVGWQDGSGFVYVSADNALVKFAIVQR